MKARHWSVAAALLFGAGVAIDTRSVVPFFLAAAVACVCLAIAASGGDAFWGDDL